MQMYSPASGWLERNSSGNRLWLGCIFVFSSLVVLPIAFWGIPENYDLPQHMRFARAYYAEMQNLGLSPSWAAEDNSGFGSVGVRFYPPLVYMVAGATQLITNSWFDTLWINILLWMFGGSVGVYFFAKEWISAPYAALAALLYAVVPYHLFQVYQAFLLAEFAASAILPFCFLFASRIVHRGSLIDVLCFSAAFSLLVLSHIPSTVIAALSLAVYALTIAEWRKILRTALNFLAAFALSLAATGFHWLRLLSELEWVQHNSSRFYNGSGFYNFRIHFFPLILGPNDRYQDGLFWALDLLVIMTVLLFVPLVVLLRAHFKHRQRRRSFRSIIGLGTTGLVALFMASWASSFLWNASTFLQKLQFPWRWLSTASLVGAVAFVLGLHEVLKRRPDLQRSISYSSLAILLLIFVFNVSQQILPSAPLSREVFASQIATLDSKESCSCWWPTWATEAAFQRSDKVSAESREVGISEWEGTQRRFWVSKGAASTVRIATFYYPYWKAIVNGVPTPVESGEDGAIRVSIPTERAEVSLYLEEPLMLLISKWISLAVWLGMFGALAVRVFLLRPALSRTEPAYA